MDITWMLILILVILGCVLGVLMWFALRNQPEIKVTPYVAVKTGDKFLDDNR